ncbi:MAG: hypothetical protein DMG11_07350 [Acidobacteria bacterium]|nr:MAG: hypothetical protein DMG11_07350 [Acidobacteriota bacterium]
MPALSEKKTELAAKYEEELQRTGKLHFTNDEDFAAYFDAQARKLVGMSGRQALKRIRSGTRGDDLHWASLTLLATLFKNHK